MVTTSWRWSPGCSISIALLFYFYLFYYLFYSIDLCTSWEIGETSFDISYFWKCLYYLGHDLFLAETILRTTKRRQGKGNSGRRRKSKMWEKTRPWLSVKATLDANPTFYFQLNKYASNVCIVGVGKIALVSSLKSFLTMKESASVLIICITGLLMPPNIKKELWYSRSILVKCLFIEKSFVAHHTLIFFSFYPSPAKAESNKSWLLTIVLE